MLLLQWTHCWLPTPHHSFKANNTGLFLGDIIYLCLGQFMHNGFHHNYACMQFMYAALWLYSLSMETQPCFKESYRLKKLVSVHKKKVDKRVEKKIEVPHLPSWRAHALCAKYSVNPETKLPAQWIHYEQLIKQNAVLILIISTLNFWLYTSHVICTKTMKIAMQLEQMVPLFLEPQPLQVWRSTKLYPIIMSNGRKGYTKMRNGGEGIPNNNWKQGALQ